MNCDNFINKVCYIVNKLVIYISCAIIRLLLSKRVLVIIILISNISISSVSIFMNSSSSII